MATETETTNAADLTDEVFTQLRERLESERERILESYKRDVRAGQKSVGEASEDVVDIANLAYARELTFSMSDAERTQLRLIDEALQRMKDGTYGLCSYSGKPIGIHRLKALPWAKFRVEYQEMMEKGLLVEED